MAGGMISLDFVISSDIFRDGRLGILFVGADFHL